MEFMTMAAARSQVRGLEELLRVAPRADLCAQLAGCYAMLGRQRDAVRLYEASWERFRTPEIAMSFAATLRELGRQDAAAAFTEYAYFTVPENGYARLMHGETLLRAGLWKQAWPFYDTGRPTKQGERMRLGLPGACREWDGRALSREEFLFVLMEGGAGDRINYARWLPLLADRAPCWKVFCYEPQMGFFLRWLGRERIVFEGEVIPELDGSRKTWWTTVFALPANFAAGPNEVPQWGQENFKFEIGNWKKGDVPPVVWEYRTGQPRLIASDEARRKYKIDRPADGLPVIGLCWEAAELSPVGDPDGLKVRSLTDAQAMRLVCATADRVHWVGVQFGKKLGYPVTSLEFETWEDTAGLLENLDALLTVDTGTLHLAGALRRPLGILLGSNSDWKYLAKGRCPFYRTAQLYRNGPLRDSGQAAGGFDHAVDLAIAVIRQDGLGAFG